MRPLFILLLCVLEPALPADGDRSGVDELTRDVDTRDAKVLLEAGARYASKSQTAWAERCYKQILKLGECPERSEAMFRLASIEIQRKRLESGYTMLREASSKYGHAGARALLEKSESDRTRAQRALLDDAEKSFDLGKVVEARKLFSEAYEMAPEKLTGALFVPRSEILPRIARCVDWIDDENYKKKIQPVERSIQPCSRCKDGGGFEKCGPCKGTGIIDTKIAIGGGLFKIRKDPCGQCGKIGWLFCPDCFGLEYAVGKNKLSPREVKALVGLVNKVRALPVLRMPLDSAIREVESQLLRVEEGAALSFIQSLKPKYTISKNLKSTFPAVPAEPDAVKAAAARWANPEQGIRSRASFLLGYACEYASYLRRFDMLRGSQKKGRIQLAEPPSASRHLPSAPVGPEVLSAFPDDGTSGWVAVQGTLAAYTESVDDPAKGRLDIQSDAPHNVHFFIWRQEAVKDLRRFEKGPWSARVVGLTASYPFPLREKVMAAPVGRRVTIVGRFLRDRLGFPRNWFEVWDLKVGLTPEQEQFLHSLEEPVEIVFPGVEAREVAAFLEVWYGVHVDLESADRKVLVDVEVAECPVGLLLAELAKCLGARVHGQAGKVRLSRSPPPAAAQDADLVIAELTANASEGTQISVKRSQTPATAASSGPEAKSELPGDPAALREAIKRGSRSMDYALAEKACATLVPSAKSQDERGKLSLLREKLVFYRQLTGSVPVSHLVGATDLARIDVRNPAGDVHQQLVRIVKRLDGALVIQPSYGGEAHVPFNRIRDEEPVRAEDYRAQKRLDIDTQSAGAEGLPARERAQRHFLLALAAKTNGFPELGTAFLEKAAANDEFEWWISTYFPERAEELTASWRRATGKTVVPEGPARVARAPAKPEKGLDPAAPVPSDAALQLPYARRHFAEGRRLLGQALPGMDDAQEHRKAARSHFEAARSGLDQLLVSSPRDLDAIQLKRDVTMMIQTCVKDLGFFD